MLVEDNIKVDRRVERTRNAIINAFKEMIIEKEFKEITIKELANKANINRKTFYLHYESMEEILFDLALEISDLLFEMLENNGFFTTGAFDINILIKCIEELLNTNYELTKKIVSAQSYRFFARNIKDLVKDSFIRKVRKKVKLSEYTMNIVGDYIASGIAKLLKDWFEDQGDLTAKDIAKLASALVFGGVKAVVDLDIDSNKEKREIN